MKIVKNPNLKNLEEIRSLLKTGSIVVYPTDTIYGIAANINCEESIKKIYKLKDRSFDKPLSVSVSSIDQIHSITNCNKKIDKILELLFPGPFTVLLEKNENVSPLISSSDIVGVRIPDNDITRFLSQKFPITSTSANISDYKTPDNIEDIIDQLQNNVDVYISVGKLVNKKPSTIIDLTKNKPQIVRDGNHQNNLVRKILEINL